MLCCPYVGRTDIWVRLYKVLNKLFAKSIKYFIYKLIDTKDKKLFKN